jgi:hypothetical protein
MHAKKLGVLIMALGSLTFFFLFWLFRLDGVILDFKNTALFLKILVATAVLPVSLYFGLYFYSGRRLANQIAGGVAAFLVICFLLGFLLH